LEIGIWCGRLDLEDCLERRRGGIFFKKMLAAILPLIKFYVFLPRGRKRLSQKSLLTVGAVQLISALQKLESEMPS
jgi:hypothetical protein